MTTLPTRSFATIVSNIAAGIQGRASKLVNFAIGSTLRAIAESFGSVVLWLQGMIGQLLLVTRLATSAGSDVDSFIADYAIIERLGSQAATGLVTFSRFSSSSSAPFVPVGATVQTSDNSQQFAVYADPTNTAYSALLGGYTMPAGVTSLQVSAISITNGPSGQPGSNGNVGANTITNLGTSIIGIDTVTNVAAFTNGFDSEGDTPLKARFKLAILGLARGNIYGTQSALDNVAVSVQFTITEFLTYSGQYAPGFYYVVVDDGSGAPPDSFMAAMNSAAQSVRPLGVQAAVYPPFLQAANISGVLTTAPGYIHTVVEGLVAAAITAGVNGRGLGNGLPFYMIAVWAFSVPGVIGFTGVTLNGLNGDAANLTPNPQNTVKVGTLALS